MLIKQKTVHKLGICLNIRHRNCSDLVRIGQIDLLTPHPTPSATHVSVADSDRSQTLPHRAVPKWEPASKNPLFRLTASILEGCHVFHVLLDKAGCLV